MKFHNMCVSINVNIDGETFSRALPVSYPQIYNHTEMVDKAIASLRAEMSDFLHSLEVRDRYRPSQIEQMIQDLTRIKAVDLLDKTQIKGFVFHAAIEPLLGVRAEAAQFLDAHPAASPFRGPAATGPAGPSGAPGFISSSQNPMIPPEGLHNG